MTAAPRGALTAHELFSYASDQLPRLLRQTKRDEHLQSPVSFPSDLESEDYLIAGQRDAGRPTERR